MIEALITIGIIYAVIMVVIAGLEQRDIMRKP